MPKSNTVDWWKSCVTDKLTSYQNREINDRTTLSGLDFALLLHILDKNWYWLDPNICTRESKNYLKELQVARNRWSHKTTDEINNNEDTGGINLVEMDRDSGTLWLFMRMFDTSQEKILDEIQEFKKSIFSPRTPIPPQSNPEPPPLPIHSSPPPIVEHTKESTVLPNGQNRENGEIEKVKRKIPRWFNNPHQINSRILVAFLRLKNDNIHVTPSVLREHCSEINDFEGNYNQMKNFGEKNHAKVFEEINNTIELWEPVEVFILESFKIHNNA